jgi:hypothetical protein
MYSVRNEKFSEKFRLEVTRNSKAKVAEPIKELGAEQTGTKCTWRWLTRG